MISFYDVAGGNKWFNKTGWENKANNYCEWFGVKCNDNGNIIEINLPSNNLAGPLPSSQLSNFYHLEKLDLSNNEFHGTIEMVGLGLDSPSLKRLEHLDLSENSLSGQLDMLLVQGASAR